MTWVAQHLTMKLNSDVHLGYLPMNNVSYSTPFVSCHIPFFALIPASVEGLDMPLQNQSYVDLEKFFTKVIRSTPLYIYHKDHFLFPWVPEFLTEIESIYMASRFNVPISDDRSSIAQAHEKEVISATPRNSSESTVLKGVFFYQKGSMGDFSLDEKGMLFWKDHSVSISTLLAGLYIGGGKKGMGLPTKTSLAPFKDKEKVWDMYTVKTDEDWPVIEVQKSQYGPIPIYADIDKNIQGQPKIMTGRRFAEDKTQVSMDEANPAYAEGWKIDQDTTVKLTDIRFARLAD